VSGVEQSQGYHNKPQSTILHNLANPHDRVAPKVDRFQQGRIQGAQSATDSH